MTDRPHLNLHLMFFTEWKKAQSQSAGEAAIGGPFTLVDEDGVPRTSAQFLGQFLIVYFGFTHCPDVCPIELTKLGKSLEMLGEA